MHTDRRALPAVWLVAAIPVGILGYLAFAISDAAPDRRVGLILVLLAGVAILTGGLLIARADIAVVRVSLFVSLLRAIGAAFATVIADLGSDRLLLGGPPAAVAVITAMLALRRLRNGKGGAATP